MSFVLTYLTVALALAYAILLFLIVRSWKTRDGYFPKQAVSFPFISILIPARNEADHIIDCVHSILQQNYPSNQMEIIVIDDHSSDNTAQLVEKIQDSRVRLLSLNKFLNKKEKITAYKKAALNLGIKQAKGDFIITTDADCLLPTTWLKSFAVAFQEEKKMILAPVVIKGTNDFLTAFQGLDVAGTMLLTGAAVFWKRPLLSNGANFGFSKAFFYTLGGYAGNENQASGDDIFLLQKAVKHNVNTIAFLSSKNALVQTQASPSWNALFWQRLRWAGKTSAYRDPYLISFQALVFLFCCLLWGGGLACLLGFQLSSSVIITAWGIKAITDVFYLSFATQSLGEKKWMRWFLPAFFAHNLYIVIIGFLAILPISATWKGRS